MYIGGVENKEVKGLYFVLIEISSHYFILFQIL